MIDSSAPAGHTGLGGALIGCAGWSLTRETMAAFPAEGSHLERYAAVFGAVEINSSFYKPHQASTYARWADSVPDGFRFSVKLPRTITHYGKLADIAEPLARFAGEAGALGAKLGCVLVQLAPSLAFDSAIASDFFEQMRATFGCMIACEARHASWFGDDATALLARHACTRVTADPPKGQPGAHVATTDARYVRLHGSLRIYYASYTDDYLAEVARTLQADHADGRTTWLIFDNTAAGAALRNALAVRAALLAG